jgi:hypothetical protein
VRDGEAFARLAQMPAAPADGERGHIRRRPWWWPFRSRE